jgi:hypothetical protein
MRPQDRRALRHFDSVLNSVIQELSEIRALQIIKQAEFAT